MRRPRRKLDGWRSGRRAWEEAMTLVTVCVGLLMLVFGFHAFHRRAAQRSEGLQQYRASTAGGRRSGMLEVGADSGASGAVALPQLRADAAVDAGASGAGLAGAGDAGDAASSGSQAALLAYCEEHFGQEWVRRWGAAAQQVCSATQQLAAGGGSGDGVTTSTITCRWLKNDTHLPAASAPHVLCDATNLRLEPSKLRRARCPRARPGYLCISPTYHHYEWGAWTAACNWPGFTPLDFSRDHQQDIFHSLLFKPGGFPAPEPGAAPPYTVEELPTLLVTREIKEHANVYHTFTDLLNAYITLRVLGWQDRPRQVVLLDAHPPGPLDMLWPVAAAGGGPAALAAVRQAQAAQAQRGSGTGGGSSTGSSSGSGSIHPWDVRVPDSSAAGGSRLLVRRVEDFQGPTLFRHAAFVPPGYASLLFAHLYEPASCALPTSLFAGFRRFLLGAFGLGGEPIEEAAEATGSGGGGGGSAHSGGGGSDDGSGGGVLRVYLITRRPDKAKRRMARQIGNEAELVAALEALGADGGVGPLSVGLLDFAGLPMEEQLAAVQRADVLIGMHGAALTYSLLLRPQAALVELWPQSSGIWRCYEHTTHWGGALYRRVANADPARHRETPQGDVTDFDAAQVAAAVAELARLVRQRRPAGDAQEL